MHTNFISQGLLFNALPGFGSVTVRTVFRAVSEFPTTITLVLMRIVDTYSYTHGHCNCAGNTHFVSILNFSLTLSFTMSPSA